MSNSSELSSHELNRAIANLLGFQVERGAKDELINPIISRWEWVFYSSVPNGDEPRTWLGSVMAETEDEAWKEGWMGELRWLPNWAEDANAALTLCADIGWKWKSGQTVRNAWRVELAYEGIDWQAEFQCVDGVDYFGARGSTAAEALARLALAALRKEM